MNDIYKDIAVRTGGDIQIGVVGPVRSGKSTFVAKFAENLIIPNLVGKNKKAIAVDELPQSADGKTIMTTEPKFVPGEAVTVRIDKTQAKIRLIDCVGYMVDGAVGHEENGAPRMVRTPWRDEAIPFSDAGEYGTAQVIKKHSTVGFVVTCDGSFTDIERSAYERAEERVVNELKSLNKPFIVLFNTVDPTADKVVSTCRDLEKKYGVATVPVNAAKLDKKTVSELFERLLFEFPIRVLGVDFPKWLRALEKGDGIIAREIDKVMEAASGIKKMSDYKKVEKYLTDGAFSGVSGINADMATGGVTISFSVRPELYYEVISKELGDSVCDEYSLLCYMRRLKAAKDGYDRISSALEKCAATGYGIASATMENADIGKPKVVKRGGQYCVRMDVAAKSLHIIGADVHEEVEVVSGTKQQCEEFAAGLESDEGAGLDTKVFGRTVTSMLEESVSKKSSYLSENVQSKLKRTVNKAVNEKKSNLICLLI